MLLIFITVFQAYADDTYSQNTKLSLNLNNATVANVLEEIQNKSEFYFLFNAKLIDVEREVSISIEDKKISEILTSLFSGTGVKYLVYDRQIILTPSDVMSLSAAMQQLKITGTVTDETGSPLPGVTIIVKGTTLGALTDASGKYTINDAPQNATLIFSFVGMATQEIPSDGQMLIDVVLKEEAIGLDEVVVIGYGTARRKDISGSVVTVKVEDSPVSIAPNINAMESLKGTITGLNIGAVNSAGETPNILIR
ncbi:MAG: carboxypeptidase-like regulatory domain-containing protein, partial [Planctomycetota bacterium]